MSESRDEATGQFSSAEPLAGLAGLEHDAGYVPLDENKVEESDELTLAEATEKYAESSMPESEIITYGPASDLADNVTLTLDEATKILNDSRAADVAQAELEAAEKIRAEVDALRGIDPEAKATKPATEAATDAQPVKEGELDPEIEKALSNPKIKEAIAAQITETETARQNYQQGLVAATTIAQSAFISQFPEFANISAEQLPQAMQALQQQDPGRFAQVESAVMKSLHLFEQHAAEQRRIDQEKQDKLQGYVKTESQRFEEMIKSVPKAERMAIENEIVAAIKEYGGETEQFIKLMQGSEFASATVQRLLFDVGKLRTIQNATKAVASRSIPPVQRPGVSSARSAGDDLSALDRRLSQTGSLKDAVALYTAQGKSRARG